MRFVRRWLVWLLFSLAACAGESPAPAAAVAAHAGACEVSDFAGFGARFESDAEFQQRNTKSPLQKLIVDAMADPAPEPVESVVTLSVREITARHRFRSARC
ncbi:hypothetical protein [Peristeroidobacter agariperforans]|uniref:hypothetical protein n=1 Tax=Peristeroidobacter agariperforans TaxID=268404 RepID=UPI00101BCBEF|nr:hypothetical protein [Peristeroidobacter agariperforans]